MRRVSLAAVMIALLVAGCTTAPEYISKPTDAPPVKYCNDATGHMAGAQPWIMGGTCCCTPTPELMEKYHADGLCLEMTVDDLIAMYRDAGIITDLDVTGTNNMDDHGPHVVKGGKSMVTPTPGTKNFEEVVSGVWEQTTGGGSGQ